MLQSLIAQAQQKPAELEELLKGLEEAKQKLTQLYEARQAYEAQIALEVARDKQFSNDTMRKAEISRRLKENPDVQEIEKEIAATKAEVAAIEVKAERVKWELRNTQTILQLAAAAVQANNQEVLSLLMSKQHQHQQETSKNAIVEMNVKVLGAMPTRKDGTVKALVETEDGQQLEVYANGKGGAAQKLCQNILNTVKVKLKKLDSGNWFAVAVA